MNASEFQQALRALGWRQVDAASRLDVSQPYISQLGSGTAPIPLWIADALDAALDAKLRVQEVVY